MGNSITGLFSWLAKAFVLILICDRRHVYDICLKVRLQDLSDILLHLPDKLSVIIDLPFQNIPLKLAISSRFFIFTQWGIFVFFYRTPLMLAVTNGHRDSVLLLLQQGSNPSAQDLRQRTATHRGVRIWVYYFPILRFIFLPNRVVWYYRIRRFFLATKPFFNNFSMRFLNWFAV